MTQIVNQMATNPKFLVHDIGSGFPVVLIHGYPLNHTIWGNQDILSDTYRIIAPDLPGFGASPVLPHLQMAGYANIIAGILDDKNIDKAIVIGHSMGGYIALAFAERFEKRLSGLGLVCSQAGADSEEGKAGRLKNAERVGIEGFEFIVETMSEKLLSAASDQNGASLKSQLKGIMKQSSAEGVVSALEAMASRKDQIETLKKLSVPVWVATGSDDALIPSEKSIQMTQALKQSSYELFVGCGHMPMMEKPQEFNLALRKFLSTVPI